MFQNVSFVGTEVAAFFLAHPASVKKWRENVPYKVLRPSAIEIPEDEETRPSEAASFNHALRERRRCNRSLPCAGSLSFCR